MDLQKMIEEQNRAESEQKHNAMTNTQVLPHVTGAALGRPQTNVPINLNPLRDHASEIRDLQQKIGAMNQALNKTLTQVIDRLSLLEKKVGN